MNSGLRGEYRHRVPFIIMSLSSPLDVVDEDDLGHKNDQADNPRGAYHALQLSAGGRA